MRLIRVRAFWGRVSTFATAVLGNTASTRRLHEQLDAEYGIAVEEYEVLIRLANAADMRSRPVELAEQPLLTAANVASVLVGLERRGLVERTSAEDPSDTYVVLTDAGRMTARDATAAHLAQVDELFGSLAREGDCRSLTGLLERLAAPSSR